MRRAARARATHRTASSDDDSRLPTPDARNARRPHAQQPARPPRPRPTTPSPSCAQLDGPPCRRPRRCSPRRPRIAPGTHRLPARPPARLIAALPSPRPPCPPPPPPPIPPPPPPRRTRTTAPVAAPTLPPLSALHLLCCPSAAIGARHVQSQGRLRLCVAPR